jgi:predicted RecA/RadA family phage recombinase
MAKVFELVSANYKETQYTAGGTVVAGTFVTQNDLYGFTLVDAVSGDLSTIIYKAEKCKCAKTAATALVAGDVAYFHSGTSLVDATASAGVIVGVFVRGAASADTHAFIEFDGKLAFAKA